ncbi:hypothetical protein E2C01_009875 [Portunus trituberculatus]|uniref:Uncharacterized protein n=1 Tax=Portunus trituberculatus TaxID=210409 RepID=A0A5B7D6W2_PORTR|nr:hypothetical protein [Portunus trituberculatus]
MTTEKLDHKDARGLNLLVAIARLTPVEALVVDLQVLDGQLGAIDGNSVRFQLVPDTWYAQHTHFLMLTRPFSSITGASFLYHLKRDGGGSPVNSHLSLTLSPEPLVWFRRRRMTFRLLLVSFSPVLQWG